MYWAGSRNGIVENSNVTTVLGPYIYIDRSKNITARNNKLNVVRMSNNRIGRPFEVVNENNAVDAKFDRFDRVQIYNNLVIGNGSRITYCVSVGDFDNDPANNRYPITLAGTLLVANNTCINTGGFYTEPALAGTFRFENNLLLDSAGLSIKDGTVMKNNAWNTVANVSGNGNLTNIDPQLSNWTTVQRFPILDLRPYKIASSNSPLINTGTPQAFTSDILGCPHQGAPDIGAFEYNPDCTQMPPTPTPSPETSPIIKPGDIVKNNCVDIFDYNALISNFGKKPGDAGYNTAANLDADPVITIFDYSILLQNFESSCVQTGNV